MSFPFPLPVRNHLLQTLCSSLNMYHLLQTISLASICTTYYKSFLAVKHSRQPCAAVPDTVILVLAIPTRSKHPQSSIILFPLSYNFPFINSPYNKCQSLCLHLQVLNLSLRKTKLIEQPVSQIGRPPSPLKVDALAGSVLSVPV